MAESRGICWRENLDHHPRPLDRAPFSRGIRARVSPRPPSAFRKMVTQSNERAGPVPSGTPLETTLSPPCQSRTATPTLTSPCDTTTTVVSQTPRPRLPHHQESASRASRAKATTAMWESLYPLLGDRTRAYGTA